MTSQTSSFSSALETRFLWSVLEIFIPCQKHIKPIHSIQFLIQLLLIFLEHLFFTGKETLTGQA